MGWYVFTVLCFRGGEHLGLGHAHHWAPLGANLASMNRRYQDLQLAPLLGT